MKIDYLPKAEKALRDAPASVRTAFFKQVKFLENDLLHSSLHAKKYDETKDRWQAISADTYIIRGLIPYPK